MSRAILNSHRDTWKRKPVIQKLYTDWYQKIVCEMVPGNALELGGGGGHLKEFYPDVLCTDITQVPWLDVIVDAQNLPFKKNCFSNIILFDVLHHIENPTFFFQEARRVLVPGGRIILMEPYISWLSWPIYHFFHTEPVDLNYDPLEIKSNSVECEPFDANQAIPKILFEKKHNEFRLNFPQLIMIKKEYMSFLVYPMSGGFEHRSLVPTKWVTPLLKFEKIFNFIAKYLAFRMLVVLQKEESSALEP